MAQQTFSFGSNPRVVITQVDANLSVRAWKEQLIRVETEGQVVIPTHLLLPREETIHSVALSSCR